MRHEYFSDGDVKNCLLDIIRQMYLDGFKPDIVAGLVRGGTVPANYLSQFLDIPCVMINKEDDVRLPKGKTILVVDDINDTGKALTDVNNALFGYDGVVKYATLVSNMTSSFEVDYYSVDVNKLEEEVWIVFPWENWWLTAPDSDWLP